ncbi:MAG TPA: PLP-dependent aminotransferase family protein [Gemmatimonadales bacterium]|nr:PLP-dependent aminotransferase family protein [Gemmatimonadales bacterium]
MTWTPKTLRTDSPVYLALADTIAEDVASGRLRPGTQMPTHRDLAQTLGVDLTTVTRGYAEARKRGLLLGRVGRGTFVRGSVPAPGSSGANADAVTDLSLNLPPHLEPDAPAQALTATLEELSKSLDVGSLLKYQDNAGMELHRQAGASWVSQRVPDADPEKLVVTNGAQHAISVLLSTLAAPGEVVMTEALTYPAFRSAAEHLSLTVRGIEMDGDGIRVDAFRRACKAGARLLYITPTLHNPTTISVSSARRAALARIAREFDVQIIEDDVYGILVDDAPAPLATYAPERTYFLSSLTKAVAGGLRIGYVLCPTSADAERVAAGVRVTTWMAAPLMAHIASRWVRSKTARDILRANRAEATRRQALAARLLSGFKWHATRFSYHGWLELPAGWTTAEFVAQARRARVAVTPGDAFAVSGRCEPPAVRLSLTAADDRDSLEDALGRVARLLKLGPRTTATVM